MKNLFKNVVRSFKNNKISLIGLSFLVFFGMGSYCVLSNTTANITNEYTSIAQAGAIHDLTISELYDVGTASYQANCPGVIVDINGGQTTFQGVEKLYRSEDEKPATTISLTSTNLSSLQDDGTYFFPIPTQVHHENLYTRTYHITLDPFTSTGLYNSYAADEKRDLTLTDFNVVITEDYSGTTIPEEVTNLDSLWSTGQPSLWTDIAITTSLNTNIFTRDYNTFTSFINNQSSIIYNAISSSETPMVKYLSNEMNEILDFKRFQSINITATTDPIFYKVIQNNPNDSLDKIVMFEDVNKRKGNALFSESDCAPYHSEIEFYKTSGAKWNPGDVVGNFVVPSSFNEVALFDLIDVGSLSNLSQEEKFLYSQIMQIRFKRMASGNNTKDDYANMFKSLSRRDMSRDEYFQAFYSEPLSNEYSTYYNYYYLECGETRTLSANENVVFTWTDLGTPQTCTISNWTSRFTIVNPQYLKNSNKSVITPKSFISFEPFIEWYEKTHRSVFVGEIGQDVAIEWLNTLNFQQFTFWIDPSTVSADSVVYDNIPGETITVNKEDWDGIDKGKHIVSCGNFNLIVWGCGLTPDFMFPVVDISRPTPNTSTECLTYCNSAAYKTIKLAYLNAQTEEYLVCKFKQHVNTDRQLILNRINEIAHELMIYPENVKIAFFATDTSNILNASSFRIAYIPNLVKIIRVVTIIMGIFIGFLCVLICGIIIKRYVENNRINIGIMRANGISKSKIILSLLPFVFVPSLIGGIAAYLIGFFLQAPALLLFSNYWMLPTPLLSFSVWPFLGCIFLPFILFTAISSIATLVVLKTKAVELMKAGSEFKTNAFSRIVKKPFKHFGILTRFRVSLAFNSLIRLSMLAIMSTLTMSSLVFSMTTFDRLSQSQIINSSQFNYNFNLELVTPTVTGGPYSYYDVSEGKIGNTDTNQYLYNTQWDRTGYDTNYNNHLTKPYQFSQYELMSNEALAAYGDADIFYNIVAKKGLLQFPNIADATGQNEDLLYLKNRINSKLLLDYNIGLGSISSNPWEIALALMPANSRNIASDAYNEIINKVGEYVYSGNAKFFELMRQRIDDDYEYILHENVGAVDYVASWPWETPLEDIVADCSQQAGKWANTTYVGSILAPIVGSYWTTFVPFFEKHTHDGNTTYTLNSDINVVGFLFSQFNPSYIKLLNTIYSDLEMMQKEYPISYGMIPINYNNLDGSLKDEFYTYIKGTIQQIPTQKRNGFNKTHEIKVEGIQKDSHFINLTNNKNDNLNDLLYKESAKTNDSYPIIINAYAAHKYKIGVGDKIIIRVNNTADRYLRQIHPENYLNDTSNEALFRIVGVSKGTNDEAFYTTQKIANDVLGLPNGTTWNKTHNYMLWTQNINATWSESNSINVVDLSDVDVGGDQIQIYNFDQSSPATTTVSRFNNNVPIGFNGVYTQNKLGKPITSMISLYSYTGLYPGNSLFSSDKMISILKFNNNLAIANLFSGIKNPDYYQNNYDFVHGVISEEEYKSDIKKFVSELTTHYGETTMLVALSGAMDVTATDKVYSNLISTFNLAEIAAISIIIPITIIVVGIISNLIINDSKKMAAMLKALGYGDNKNAMSILALFIPTIALGLLLAIPLSFGLVAGYQALIFTSANILVDVTQKWWYYAVAVCGIGAILVSTYAVGFVSLKKDRLVDQIK